MIFLIILFVSYHGAIVLHQCGIILRDGVRERLILLYETAVVAAGVVIVFALVGVIWHQTDGGLLLYFVV